MPTRCRAGCICNNEVWRYANYTPQKFYDFYAAQFAHIAQKFPGKSMSYMSIPSGFPRVGAGGCYDGSAGIVCPPFPTDLPFPGGKEQTNTIIPIDMTIPGGEEQTNTIIANAFATAEGSAPGAFVVEYQGLDPVGGPNNSQVADANALGKPTMFQTSATGQVGTPGTDW